jgi:hypothetical protein
MLRVVPIEFVEACVLVWRAGGLSWDVPSRPGVDKSPKQMKIKYGVKS